MSSRAKRSEVEEPALSEAEGICVCFCLPLNLGLDEHPVKPPLLSKTFQITQSKARILSALNAFEFSPIAILEIGAELIKRSGFWIGLYSLLKTQSLYQGTASQLAEKVP
jgi:hypothetical protein